MNRNVIMRVALGWLAGFVFLLTPVIVGAGPLSPGALTPPDPKLGTLEDKQAGNLQEMYTNLTKFGGKAYGATVESSPSVLVAKVINAGLGVLGTVFLIYLIYGGVTWMTAAGESGKTDQAKKTINTAVIGLIITVIAFSVSLYVTSVLQKSLL